VFHISTLIPSNFTQRLGDSDVLWYLSTVYFSWLAAVGPFPALRSKWSLTLRRVGDYRICAADRPIPKLLKAHPVRSELTAEAGKKKMEIPPHN
jgi:hypothetical protein